MKRDKELNDWKKRKFHSHTHYARRIKNEWQNALTDYLTSNELIDYKYLDVYLKKEE